MFPQQTLTKTYDYQRRLRSELIIIDSGDRDRATYPNPNSYTINFLNNTIGKQFRNVKSLQLITGVFPHKQSIDQEPYLILDIKELDNNSVFGTNNYVYNANSIIQLDRPIKDTYFWNMKTDVAKNMLSEFDPPITLSKMSINIRKKDGTLFNFGTDNALPNDPDKSLQHMLTFEVIYELKEYSQENKSIYGTA